MIPNILTTMIEADHRHCPPGACTGHGRLQDLSPAGNPAVVPAPSVCQTCYGEGVLGTVTQSWCHGCRCTTCGARTDTPPECRECFLAEDDMQKRRSDQ